MQKYLAPAEALRALNEYNVLKTETKDGYILMTRKSKTLYETKVFENGKNEPYSVLNGNIVNVLKTLNNPKVNSKFYVETGHK